MKDFNKGFDKVLSFFRILTLSLIVLTIILGCINEALKKESDSTGIKNKNTTGITLEVFSQDEHPSTICV